MQTTLLNTKEDIIWLCETALKPANITCKLPSFASAIIYGNEDCPQKIELFADTNPSFEDKPIAIFVLNSVMDYEVNHIKFTVKPTSIVGHSLLQWDVPGNKFPRSIQMETEIAKFLAEAANNHYNYKKAIEESAKRDLDRYISESNKK